MTHREVFLAFPRLLSRLFLTGRTLRARWVTSGGSAEVTSSKITRDGLRRSRSHCFGINHRDPAGERARDVSQRAQSLEGLGEIRAFKFWGREKVLGASHGFLAGLGRKNRFSHWEKGLGVS